MMLPDNWNNKRSKYLLIQLTNGDVLRCTEIDFSEGLNPGWVRGKLPKSPENGNYRTEVIIPCTSIASIHCLVEDQ